MDTRIGFGFDVHQLKKDNKLWLGGIEIPAEKGAVGHSDADVLLHAICDALLGAVNMRDIGFHFPDKDPQYKGISSLKLLEKVYDMVKAEGYFINNMDSTISLEEPKIAEYIPHMQEKIAETLKVNPNQISIKATTTEKLGFTGRKEGIAAQAIVLIGK